MDLVPRSICAGAGGSDLVSTSAVGILRRGSGQFHTTSGLGWLTQPHIDTRWGHVRFTSG